MTADEDLPPLEGKDLESPAGWFDPTRVTLAWAVGAILSLPDLPPEKREEWNRIFNDIRFHTMASSLEFEMIREYQEHLTSELKKDFPDEDVEVPPLASPAELAELARRLREYRAEQQDQTTEEGDTTE